MTKKKWIILSLIIVLIGGLAVFGYTQKEKEAREARNNQVRVAEYIVGKYDDVYKIEFTDYKYHTKTGSWNVKAIINNDNILGVSWYTSSSDNYELTWNSNEFHLVEKTSKSSTTSTTKLEDVEVIYEGEQ